MAIVIGENKNINKLIKWEGGKNEREQLKKEE